MYHLQISALHSACSDDIIKPVSFVRARYFSLYRSVGGPMHFGLLCAAAAFFSSAPRTPAYISPCRVPARCRDVGLCVADGGGGGGGSGCDSSGDGGEEPEEAALLAAFTADDALPPDMLDALCEARIGTDELINWRRILNNPLTRLLASTGSFARARLLAWPRIVEVVAIEVSLGSVTGLAAEASARGDRLIHELDFVLANQLLVIAANVALVLALAPAVPLQPPPVPGSLAAYCESMPAFALQPGAFTAAQRAACFASKAALFGGIGALTSAVGVTAARSLVSLRAQLDPSGAYDRRLAPVLPTSAAYATFMIASSNTRYQLLNCIESTLVPRLPAGSARTTASFAARLYNNYVGSGHWIWLARYSRAGPDCSDARTSRAPPAPRGISSLESSSLRTACGR
jgi:hypothetical protein